MITLKQILLLSFSLLILVGCSKKEEKSSGSKLGPTQIIQLEGQQTQMRIPTSFKRSSRYRIREDLPFEQADSIQLRTLENILHGFEFEDAEVDFFVDTTSAFRFFILLDIPRIELNKQGAQMLLATFNKRYQDAQARDPFLKVEKVESKLYQHANRTVAKYKYQLSYPDQGYSMYETTFCVTTKLQSLLIIEAASVSSDIELYLGTIRE